MACKSSQNSLFTPPDTVEPPDTAQPATDKLPSYLWATFEAITKERNSFMVECSRMDETIKGLKAEIRRLKGE